jgi:hypothetical protein
VLAPSWSMGDYGPNNVLLDPEAQRVVAIVDWEWVHAGGPAEDLAWCEWILRMHHPDQAGTLGALFDGYGRCPPWAERQRAMVIKCELLMRLSERREPGGRSVRSASGCRFDRQPGPRPSSIRAGSQSHGDQETASGLRARRSRVS